MTNALRVVIVLAAVLAAPARDVWADCAPVRPATVQEQKLYADGFALFQRVSPPAPQGWESHDDVKDGVLKEVCAGPRQVVSAWRFNRSYRLTAGVEARQAEALKKTTAVMANAAAVRKANEAKMADVQKRMDAVMQKVQALVAAKKYDQVDPLNNQMAALMEEQKKLMDVDAQDAALKAIEAEAGRDTSASFALLVGQTDFEISSAFPPVTVAGIKAFRQLTEAEGSSPSTADFIVVMKPAATPKGPQTIVYISGDPARAEALLKAAKLQ